MYRLVVTEVDSREMNVTNRYRKLYVGVTNMANRFHKLHTGETNVVNG